MTNFPVKNCILSGPVFTNEREKDKKKKNEEKKEKSVMNAKQ